MFIVLLKVIYYVCAQVIYTPVDMHTGMVVYVGWVAWVVSPGHLDWYLSSAEEDYEDVVEEFLEEGGYLEEEEEEVLSFEEDGKMSKEGRSGGRATPGTCVKRTRLFRI